MALLPPFPSANWASEAPPDLPSAGYPADRLREAWGPRDPAALAAFISQAVTRYKERVRVWEFLNEPIYTDYSLPGERVRRYPGKRYTPVDYVRLLRTAAAAMRASDPKCRVMGGVGSGPGHLTRELMEARILDTIEIFNLHIYPGARAPEGYIAEMDRLLQGMEAHGGRKPIWITEFSYYGADDLPRRPFIPGERSWSEQRLLRDERECAEYTVRFFTIMLARGVEKIFIHSGASGAANAPSLECCLFDYGGAPRKIFPALAVLTELLGPQPKLALDRGGTPYPMRVGEEGYAAAFETGTRSVVVLWSAAGKESNPTRIPRGVKCLDIMGRECPTEELRLGTAPIYLVGAAGKAAAIAQALRDAGKRAP
jgi:hypothetical protein